MRTSMTFDSAGEAVDAWHFPALSDELSTDAGRPAVVMAHGLGCTKDSGLEGFAEGLSAAGLEVIAFDFRGFGASCGRRHVVNVSNQLEDYRAAIRAVAALPGVDPNRIVLWGTSLSGGHVLEAAPGRTDIAAIVSLTPLVSGPATVRHASSPGGLRAALAPLAILLDLLSPLRFTMPVVPARNRSAHGALMSIAGETFKNKVNASFGLHVLRYRPGRRAANLTSIPTLFQIADFDTFVPPTAALQVAVKARAVVHHYPCDHFDVYSGKAWHQHVLAHQVKFLTRVLWPGEETELPRQRLTSVGSAS